MKLLIKQRVFSWTDSYDIYDENGNVKYCVNAEFLSIGHRLHVYDASGREVGFIKEKVLTLLPVFEIYIFDDTFSALDYKTDATLRSELKKYTKNATTLIVAQRIGTIINASKIINKESMYHNL